MKTIQFAKSVRPFQAVNAALFVVAILAVAVPGAWAAQQSWYAALTNNWATYAIDPTATNWNTTAPHVTWTNGNDALFANSSSAVQGPVVEGSLSANSVTMSGGSHLLIMNTNSAILNLGAGGLTNAANNTSFTVNCPLNLTASQTWSPGAVEAITINSNITSTGTAAVTVLGGTVTLAGADSFTGTMTVTNAGTLTLNYANQNSTKLDPTSPLNLAGATINLNGANTALTEAVNGVTLFAGGSSVVTGSGNVTGLQMGALTRNLYATLNVSASNSSTTLTNDATGILGGWFTDSGSIGWAATNGLGLVVGNGGTADNNPADWTATENVNLNGTLASSISGNLTMHTLRLGNGTAGNGWVTDLGGFTLTLAGGGLMTANNNPVLSDGYLTTGLASGELFIHTLNNANLTNSAVIEDNGATPTVLVKAGGQTLVLAAVNTYTGPTYVNGGGLEVNTGATLGAGQINVQGAATLTFNRTDTYNLTNALSGLGTVQSIGSGTVNLTSSNSYFPGTVQNTSIGTLNLSVGGGASSFGNLKNASSGLLVLSGATGGTGAIMSGGVLTSAAGGTVQVNGGSWTVPATLQPGANSSLIINGGNLIANGGASGFSGSNLTINAGSLIVAPDRLSMNANAQTLNINGGQLLVTNNAYGIRLANTSGNSASQAGGGVNFMGLQTNGVVTVANTGEGFEMGGTTGVSGTVAAYTLAGGSIQLPAGTSTPKLQLGADTTGLSETIFTLTNTGKLFMAGTLSGAQGAGAKQVFDFEGGTLVAGTITATDLAPLANPTAQGTLVNNGGTLAPGDIGTPGKTLITGNYTINSGTLAIDLGGATQASAFQNAGAYYDCVSVSGTASLGGNLAVNSINGFKPALNNTFTILIAAPVVGTFAAASFDGAGYLEAGNGVFTVGYTATSVVLTNAGALGASFTLSPSAGTPPLSVTFSDASTATGALTITNWIWNFGDGSTPVTNTSNASVPHTYTSAGTYAAILTVQGQYNTSSTATNSFIGAPVLTWAGGLAGNAWDTSTANWRGAVTIYANGDGALFNDSGSANPPVALNQAVSPGIVTFNNTNNNYVIAGPGKITGSTGLNKNGPGLLTLLTTNDYSGVTDIEGGALVLGNGVTNGSVAGPITDDASVVYDLAGNNSVTNTISGNGSLTSAGTGVLTLASAANTYNGGTTVSNGTLSISSDANLGNSGGPLTLSSATLTPTTTLTLNNRAVILNGSGGTINNASQLTITNPISGSGGLVKTNSGLLVLSATNAYAGGTVIGAGELQTAVTGNADAGLGAGTGAITIYGGATFTVYQGGNLTSSRTFTLTNGSAKFRTRGNRGMTLNGYVTGPGGLTVDSGSLAVNLGYPANDFAGDMTLGYNTGSGDYNAILQLGTNNALPYGPGKGNLVFVDIAGFTDTLDLNGCNAQINGLSGGLVAGSMFVDNKKSGTNVYTLTVGNNNASSTFGGIITNTAGTLALTKIGTGTLILTNANGYNGSTSISNGTLALLPPGSINSSTNLAIAAGGTFDVSALASPYGLSTSSSLMASGAGSVVGTSAAAIKGASGGTISLGSQPIIINYDGSHPALYIEQGSLSLNGNAFTVNSSSPLALGNYTIIQQNGGAIATAGSFTVSGTALAAGTITIVNNTNVVLTVTSVAGSGASQPQVTGVSQSAGNLVLVGSGTARAGFNVLSSTNLALRPFSSWNVAASGTFSGNGTTTNNLPINLNLPQQFFLFQSPP